MARDKYTTINVFVLKHLKASLLVDFDPSSEEDCKNVIPYSLIEPNSLSAVSDGGKYDIDVETWWLNKEGLLEHATN
jgi:hypothetical protein